MKNITYGNKKLYVITLKYKFSYYGVLSNYNIAINILVRKYFVL